MYNKLNSSSTSFANAIKKFDGEFPVSHLKLTVNNNLATNVYGETQPPVNFGTEIQFNENSFAFLSDLGKATVFAHEIIHAEIFRKMLSAAQRRTSNSETTQQQISLVNSLKNNLPGLYDYYEKRYKSTWIKKFTSKKLIEAIKEHPESRREWLLRKFSFDAQKSERAKNYKLWQDGFHPIILDTLEKIEQRINYIHYNPVEAKIVFQERDYVNSSYRNYEEENSIFCNVNIEHLW